MSKLSNEVKIAEKLKFWEEQDAINQELIPRVIKNYEMISALAVQNEQSIHLLALTKDEITYLKSQFEEERLNSHQLERKMDELVLKINALEERIKRNEESIHVLQNLPPKTTATRDLLLLMGVFISLLLSIINFLL